MDDVTRLTIAELLARAPRAAAAFQGLGMACVGCSMAGFDTVAEAAAVYGLELDDLVRELRTAAGPALGGGRSRADG